jgi:hypothetical protein
LVIGVIILFIGASIVSSSIIEKSKRYETDAEISEISNQISSTILFEDDFNDNEKDFTKWMEIYADGFWTESNQRCEFMVWEPGYGYRNKEGIESTEFIVHLSKETPLVVSWDIITDIHSTNWAGKLFLEITDGVNWIWARFHRYQLATHFMDSNDATYSFLSTYKPNGYWSNEIQLFSDRYIVKMAGDSSGEIYDTIFTPDSSLRIRIYIICAGEQPQLFQRSGFDNVIVTNGNYKSEPESKKALIFGRIQNLIEDNNQVIFDALRIRVITVSPFSFNTYTDNEKVVSVGSKIGILTDSLAFGFFNILI